MRPPPFSVLPVPSVVTAGGGPRIAYARGTVSAREIAIVMVPFAGRQPS